MDVRHMNVFTIKKIKQLVSFWSLITHQLRDQSGEWYPVLFIIKNCSRLRESLVSPLDPHCISYLVEIWGFAITRG